MYVKTTHILDFGDLSIILPGQYSKLSALTGNWKILKNIDKGTNILYLEFCEKYRRNKVWISEEIIEIGIVYTNRCK